MVSLCTNKSYWISTDPPLRAWLNGHNLELKIGQRQKETQSRLINTNDSPIGLINSLNDVNWQLYRVNKTCSVFTCLFIITSSNNVYNDTCEKIIGKIIVTHYLRRIKKF